MYSRIRNLSIDVALGAACMMWLVASFLGVEVDRVYYVLLILVVWLIYTTDHLLDARNTPNEASTERHRLHQRHFKAILVSAVMAACLAFLLIPRDLPVTLLLSGLSLSLLLLVYFVALIWARKTRFRYVLKELFIAAVYTAGVSLIPLYAAWPVNNSGIWFFLFRIFAIALANLLIFSLIEQKHDRTDKHPSAITWFGFNRVRFWIRSVLWLNVGIGLIRLYFSSPDEVPYILTLSAMDFTLLFIYYYRDRMEHNEWYRILGDGIFFYPLLILLYENLK